METVKITQDYPDMNLKLLKSDPEMFNYLLLVYYVSITDFKVSKVGKTTNKGTRITYTRIKDTEDLMEYEKLFNDMVDRFNEKYGIKEVS